jgi:BarA-like signal transduction histidine kinase
MEEKIKLLEKDEPRLFRSLARIAEYYIRASKYIQRYLRDYTEEIVYKRSTIKLPDSFKTEKNDYLVLNVGKYCFENPTLKNKYLDVGVECHVDEKGKILAVYLDR